MTPFTTLAPEVTATVEAAVVAAVAEAVAVVTAKMYEVFAASHVSPADTVEDGLRHIAEHLDIVTTGEVIVPTSLAVPTAKQVSEDTDFFDLFAYGARAVALPTGEWMSHPAVIAAPGIVDDHLHLAPWALDADALDRVEDAGVTPDYALIAFSRGIRTLDALLEAWNDGVPVECLTSGGAL